MSWDTLLLTLRSAPTARTVRTQGRSSLDVGSLSRGSEVCPRKTRAIDVVCNEGLVGANAPAKSCIVLIHSTLCRQQYASHWALSPGRRKAARQTPEEDEVLNKKRSKEIQKKYDERKKNAQISRLREGQFQQSECLVCIT